VGVDVRWRGADEVRRGERAATGTLASALQLLADSVVKSKQRRGKEQREICKLAASSVS
jgi:hypothetical protein